ncbi:MAG: SAM hydrolase/SAM-dependent halogenase family protein [Steroidobacteraceae bacterium]
MRFTAARIVDLTHQIPAQRPAEAGFWLARCFEYFPPGTVHVAVVDPGVGTSRRILCASVRGHALLAPDNGLLAPVAARCGDLEVQDVGAAGLAALGIQVVSATFHGRDIFAPVAAELAAGRIAPPRLGDRLPGPWTLPGSAQRAGWDLNGSVVTVDHFGNLITDIESAQLAPLEDPQVTVGGLTLALRRTYGDARPGELIALVNSFDVLEIAAAGGSAAATLGLARGAPVLVRSLRQGVRAVGLPGGGNPL